MKRRQDPITAGDLKEYLQTQDGFDLELFVYRTAKELGLHVTHGGSYEDPTTRKTRQYDVRASAQRGNRRIDMAIEAKSLDPSYPLLVSRIPRARAESYHQIVHSHKPPAGPGGLVMPFMDSTDVVTVKTPDSIYELGAMVGKSTAQVGRNDRGDLKAEDSDVYNKWTQALASASELVSEATNAHETNRVDHFWTLVMPLIVVTDATLWVADYSEDGVLQADPYQVTEATVYVDHQHSTPLTPVYTLTHIHFLTRGRMADFLRLTSSGLAFWEQVFPRGVLGRAV